MKNEETGEDVMIPQLESFSRIDRLLVSKAYYFVYVTKEQMMYCVNRVDGTIKNSRYVEDPRLCTFFEGYLYFTDDDGNGGQAIFRVPAGELDAEAEMCVDLDQGCSITVMCSCDEGIVFRETGNKVVIGLFTAKYLNNGEAELHEYETDYNYGRIRELNALGTDIYFGGFSETDYSWNIGRFDLSTGQTTMLTDLYSQYYIDLTLYEEGGEQKIAFYSYPYKSSDGDPYLGYMNLDGSDLSKIFLIRHD